MPYTRKIPWYRNSYGRTTKHIRELKRRLAPGSDEIPAELFKEMDEDSLRQILEVLNTWRKEKHVEVCLIARVVLICPRRESTTGLRTTDQYHYSTHYTKSCSNALLACAIIAASGPALATRSAEVAFAKATKKLERAWAVWESILHQFYPCGLHYFGFYVRWVSLWECPCIWGKQFLVPVSSCVVNCWELFSLFWGWVHTWSTRGLLPGAKSCTYQPKAVILLYRTCRLHEMVSPLTISTTVDTASIRLTKRLPWRIIL